MAVELKNGADLRALLCRHYEVVRKFTEKLSSPLSPEDATVQSMPDASPAKWHLAHTTWFFETFVLAPFCPDYRPVNSAYSYLFNSYYIQAGERFPRPQRGVVSRPGLADISRYRSEIDRRVLSLLEQGPPAVIETLAPRVILGLNHEQQHQELLLTDIKHALSQNPLAPAYSQVSSQTALQTAGVQQWVLFPEGLRWIGHDGEGFAYDNESPPHRVFLQEYALASRPVTNAEYLVFIEDGGYDRPELWLSDGWAAAAANAWRSPLYWQKNDRGDWENFTLHGLRPLDPAQPVCHVSYYEADAYARWAEAALPSEEEWEAAAGQPRAGNFAESGAYHPLSAGQGTGLQQVFGDVWEWTASAYLPYPGFRPAAGALGEYNGKFMCNQFVLRGGSCTTPESHIRPTYRNFFYPDARWQFTGIRLVQRGEPLHRIGDRGQ